MREDLRAHMKSLEATLLDRRFIKRAVIALCAIILMMAIANYVFTIALPHVPRFLSFEVDVDNEGNWTTWFNVNLDQFAAVAAILVAWLVSRQPDHKRRDVIGWLLVGGVFLYIGMDDAAQIHEYMAGDVIAKLADWVGRFAHLAPWIRWYLWIPLLGIPGVIVMYFVMEFLRRNLWPIRWARWLAIIALALFLSNFVTEGLESRITAPTVDTEGPRFYDQLVNTDHQAWLALKLLTLAQEVTEMIGAILFMASFMLFGESLLNNSTQTPAMEVTKSTAEKS
jgi:hypothetical protein